MSCRWPEETTKQFVNTYVQHECLWNLKSVKYKNTCARQAAYLDIANTMNIEGFGEKEVKMKIKNIRSTYSQELKKIKDSKKSGVEPVYVPILKWFNILDECLRNCAPKIIKTESNVVFNNSHSSDTDNEEICSNTAVETLFDVDYDPLILPTKRRKLSQLSSQQNNTNNYNNNSMSEENEFDIFGKHVGVQLKTLPLLLAIEAQEHIQLYLNRIRRQHLQNA